MGRPSGHAGTRSSAELACSHRKGLLSPWEGARGQGAALQHDTHCVQLPAMLSVFASMHTLNFSFLSDLQLSVLEAEGEFRAFCWAAGRDRPRDGKLGGLGVDSKVDSMRPVLPLCLCY